MKNTAARTMPGLPRQATLKWRTLATFMLGALILSGCSLFEGREERPFLPASLPPLPRPQSDAPGEKAAPAVMKPESTEHKTGYFQTPKPPEASRTRSGPQPRSAPEAVKDEVVTAVNLESMPIAQFSDAVFGTILKRNVSIDPQVQQRTDLVSLRTGKPQTAEQLFLAAQAVLRSYGIAVSEYQGLVRIVPDKAETGYLPEIRRGRALPDVPSALRPVFYLVELEHTAVAQATNWLRTLYPGRLTVQDDPARNALMLSGQSDIVAGALQTLQLLDQPLLRGRVSARISPVFWSAEDMARRLVEILTAEGYAAATSAGANTPTLILPIAAVNSVIVFTGNEQLLNHALRWAQELDQSPQGKGGGFINYPVRNTNAADLAKTLQEIFGGGPSTVAPTTTGAASGSPSATSASAKKVVVHPGTNSLIIQATPTEYQQWYSLIRELDRPAKTALIMATVAEVRLTDEEKLGFQWLLDQFRMNGNLVNIGSTSSIAPPSEGPRITFANLNGTPRALISFLATSNKIRILSNPSIIARNGESASIQVGQDVPILTSQLTNANTGGGGPDGGTLQTVQYRSTGVIFKVKPVIHSGGKLDLDVSQEVSAVQSTETGIGNSPVILTRRLESKLTVTDGSTMLLGGLIQENRDSGHAGIPLLKDIPYVGALFRTAANTRVERTELVILLTPYIMEDNFEATAMTEAFRNQFSWASTAPDSIPRQDKSSRAPQTDAAPSVEAVGKQSSVPPAGEARSPQPSTAGQPGERYRSKPYLLPETDGPPRTPSVVIEQQPPAEGGIPSSAPPHSPSSVANSPNAALAESPEGTTPVNDEALRQELLKAIKGGN